MKSSDVYPVIISVSERLKQAMKQVLSSFQNSSILTFKYRTEPVSTRMYSEVKTNR